MLGWGQQNTEKVRELKKQLKATNWVNWHQISNKIRYLKKSISERWHFLISKISREPPVCNKTGSTNWRTV